MCRRSGHGRLASDAAQAAQGAAVTAEQASMRSAIAALGAKQLSSLKIGANGVRVRVAASEIANLRALPGVRSVARVTKFRPDNITSVPAIGAPQVWDKYKVRGKGVSIGIIDSGIDYLHADFGGAGDPAAYDANNKNVIEAGTFPTAKVVGGFDFAGPTYNADDDDSVPAPDPDPLDGNGHGSHVAGTAAGIGVPGSVGQGVAPEAKLYALKVFNDTEGSTNLVSEAIEWALDPNGDGNMKDHLDVINMSLGSPFGEPGDPSAISADNAANLGIIVVTSAGNEGPIPYITGSPGIAPSVISTAAVTPAGRECVARHRHGSSGCRGREAESRRVEPGDRGLRRAALRNSGERGQSRRTRSIGSGERWLPPVHQCSCIERQYRAHQARLLRFHRQGEQRSRRGGQGRHRLQRRRHARPHRPARHGA